MANDPEKQLYEDMADLTERVPKLANEIKSLKSKMTKLSNQVSKVNIVDFQGQLDSLNDRIVGFEKSILKVQRNVAANEVEDLYFWLGYWIKESLLNTVPFNPLLHQEVREFLNTERALALQIIWLSTVPLECSSKFRQKCVKYFKDHNLNAFAD